MFSNPRRKIFLILLTLVLYGCGTGVKQHDDPFFNDVGTWDSLRIPLIKPYEMFFVNKELGWSLPLKGNMPSQYYYYKFAEVFGVTKFSIQKNAILVYSPDELDVDESVGQKVLHWFVIIPDENLETGFANEEEFLGYINQLGIPDPNWLVPNNVYKQFYKTGCLDWIPNCQ